MINQIVESGIKNILQIELAVQPDNNQKGMTASGMIVINPPWKLQQEMKELLPWLSQQIDPNNIGHHIIKQLVNE